MNSYAISDAIAAIQRLERERNALLAALRECAGVIIDECDLLEHDDMLKRVNAAINFAQTP